MKWTNKYTSFLSFFFCLSFKMERFYNICYLEKTQCMKEKWKHFDNVKANNRNKFSFPPHCIYKMVESAFSIHWCNLSSFHTFFVMFFYDYFYCNRYTRWQCCKVNRMNLDYESKQLIKFVFLLFNVKILRKLFNFYSKITFSFSFFCKTK